jgi:hypothetical protein
MIMKQPKPRGFEYFPYYHKEIDIEDDDAPRIRFRRLSIRPPSKKRPIILLAILIAAVFVLYQYFGQLVKNDPTTTTTSTFEVEEIIVVD